MEAKKTEERLTVEVQSVTEKFTRTQSIIRSAHGRLQNLTQEKEQVCAKNIFLCVYGFFFCCCFFILFLLLLLLLFIYLFIF